MVSAMATITATAHRILALPPLRRGARVPLAWRLTLGRRARFAHAVLAAASVVALVVGQVATMAGLLRTPRWVRATGASVWVTTSAGRPGWTPLPTGLAERVGTIDGVESVTPVTRQMAEIVVTGEPNAAILVAWDPGALRAPLVSGREPASAGEIVLDAGFAAARGIGLDSATTVRIGDRASDMRVVGLGRDLSLLNYQVVLLLPAAVATIFGDPGASAAGAASDDLDRLAASLDAAAGPAREAEGPTAMYSTAPKLAAAREAMGVAAGDARRAAVSLREAEDLVSAPKANSLALKVAPGREEEVARRIRSMSDLVGSIDAHSAAHEEHQVLETTAAPFLPVLAAIVGLVLGLGCVVLALLLLGMVGESAADYATLAAIGAGRGRLSRVVFAQCLIVAVSAGVVGAAIGAGLVVLMRRLMPMLPLACPPVVIGIGIAAALAMGVLASLPSLRSLGKLQPESVFRS